MSKKKLFVLSFFVMLLPGIMPSGAFAQGSNVKYERVINGQSLTSVLKQLEEKFSTKIVFSYEDLGTYKVSARVNANNIEEALKQVLKGLPVTYSSHGKIYTVKATKANKTSTTTDSEASKVKVSGRVIDENGDAIPGATIKLADDGNVGTITDVNGRFVMELDKGKGETLEVSFLGMENATYYVNGRKNLSNIVITMTEDRKALDEVVVIGYGTAKAKDLTGSVSRLSEKDIESAPMTANIAGMLQGRAAGVNVMVSNASPTSPVSVVIRGQSSISGDGQPLWVIDGVPQYSSGISGDVSNTLYNLNLNDVQSIDILKDASATAIYGSRAANGVVIVTTKSGAEGMRPTIEFSARYGWQNIDANKMRTLSPEEYIAYSKKANMLEAFREGSLTYYNKKWMDVSKFNQIGTSQWDMTDIDDLWLPNAYYDGNDDYWDMMTQKAAVQDYSVSIRGGSQQNSYYASINYKEQDGIVKGSDSRYFGGRFNFESIVSEKFKFGMNMDASMRCANNKDGMIETIINMRPDYPAYAEDGSINLIDYYSKNPLVELLNKNYSNSRNINASGFLEYNIFPFLKYRTTLNAQYIDVKSEKFTRRSYEGEVNEGTESNRQHYTIIWDNLLTFFKTFDKHDIQAMIGHSVERTSEESLMAKGTNYPDDDVLTNLGSAAEMSEMDSYKNAASLVSVFARLQYKYDNRYLLTGTFRADGSSRFGKNSRWGYFPSAACAWIISEEDFMKPVRDFVSYLKLRTSFGITGSQNLGYYDYVGYVGTNVFEGEPGMYPVSLGNNTLEWESQSQTDIALDYGFLNDRIRGSFGWYRKYVDNLITTRPVPLSSGFSAIPQNIGAISNTGVEFDITVDILKTRDLTWQVNFNASHNKGVLEKLNGVETYLGGAASDKYKLEEGGELGRFYGYVEAGRLFENGEEVWAIKPIDPETGKQTNYRVSSFSEGAGDIYVVDLDGDGKITADGDRTYIGNSNPDVFGGLGSTLYWKGIMLNFNFTYSLGGKRFWLDEYYTFGRTDVYNTLTLVNDSWTMVGADAKYPVATHYGIGQNNVFTNKWLHNASYLRLTSLNLSYKLPSEWFRKSVVKGIELTFQATNLFTVTKYPGMDPQGNFATDYSALYGYGTDYSSYPAARTYNIGLKLTIN
ncbi:MAG: SusC/RagA family TonB-linked outer membrane protein [Prevotella sp.]